MHNGFKLYKTLQNNKPNILIFIDWFKPAYKAGGPIQSAHNIVQQLNADFNFYVVTSNTDIDGVLHLPDTSLNAWTAKEKYRIIYLDQAHQTGEMFQSLFRERDYAAVYFNSLFSKKFTLLPLRLFRKENTPLILAPRGMLGKGALSIKPVKKHLFLQAIQLAGWHKKVTWHATAETEKQEIQSHFSKKVKINVAANLSKKPKDKLAFKPKQENKLQLFFLSRISFKKNLLAAIKALAAVNKRYQIQFSIIGPTEEAAYWEECSKAIDRLPENIKVVLLGAQPNHQLQEILQEQHVLLLPTRHENFGHVIVESWQNGCPVIISDQTPWQDLEKDQTGVALPLKKEEAFTQYIEQFAAMDQNEFNKWSKSAHTKSLEIANSSTILEKYKQLFSLA